MSTHLHKFTADASPVTEADLLKYFASGAKSAHAWRIGAEFEKFALDRLTGRQIGFDDGIEAILKRLVESFDWEGHEEAGRLTTLTRGSSTISVEPGGQLELSTAPARQIGELKDELDRHLLELRAVTDPSRVAWVAAGVSPWSAIEEIPLNPRPRHRFMADYLPRKCRYGLHMMKATTSTQVTFDYRDENDAVQKFVVALTLSPIINAAFANAPLLAGKPTGFTSFRAEIWRGMDPDRSGFLEELLAGEVSFESWTGFVLDVPLLFIDNGGKLLPAPGMTFRDWMIRGFDGRYPTLDDWTIHLSTVFTEARLKRYLEIRGADATPSPLALAVAAVWKGLLYDARSLSAAVELARTFPVAELGQLSQLASRQGLRATYRGRTLAGWCGDAVTMAAEGLQRLSREQHRADESPFLEPLREVLESGQSPGDLWPISDGIADILERCEYREAA